MSKTLDAPTTATGTDAADAPTVIEAIVDAVADAEGVSALDLEPPLAAVVDPDALESLVGSMGRAPGNEPGRIQFVYGGYDVTVTGTGDVTVRHR